MEFFQRVVENQTAEFRAADAMAWGSPAACDWELVRSVLQRLVDEGFLDTRATNGSAAVE